jgi:maltoporin
MIEANTTNSASYANFPGNTGNDQFRLREAFVQGGHILESQPDAKFWAGERYYCRYHGEIKVNRCFSQRSPAVQRKVFVFFIASTSPLRT